MTLPRFVTGDDDPNDINPDGTNPSFIGNDFVDARLGDDVVDGGFEADTIFGGGGNDSLLGGADSTFIAFGDSLNGDDGNDVLSGQGGEDTLTGGFGNDRIDGGTGADIMIGGVGNDLFIVDDELDVIVEKGETFSGTDNIEAFADYTLSANVENGIAVGALVDLTGNELKNSLTGNDTINLLDGKGGEDTLSGGGGDDTYVVDQTDDKVIEANGGGLFDQVFTTADFALPDEVENLFAEGSDDLILTGNSGSNAIFGNAGNNKLSAGAGIDLVDGGKGADQMFGGLDSDTYFVDDVGDVVTETANGGGADKVLTKISFTTLSANVEIGQMLFVQGSGVRTLTGNAGINQLFGSNFNDILNGAGGADEMRGVVGNDTYIVDDAGDKILGEELGTDTDTVLSSINFTLSTGLENLTLTGAAALSGTGNAANNTIIGNDGANVLNGGAGIDFLVGGLGNDIFDLDTQDQVSEAAGGGIDLVRINSSFSLAALTQVENLSALTASATNALNFTGNALANRLTGNNGANILNGSSGRDTISGNAGKDKLIGGTGKDVLKGGTGKDAFVFNASASKLNTDVIVDFSHTDDHIQLDRSVLKSVGSVGKLKAAAFFVGKKAHDASDRIIYDDETGNLFYDSDGTGSKFAAVKIGVIANEKTAKVSLSDFIVIP